MRGKIVFLVILAMLVGLVYLVGARTRDPHVVPKPKVEEPADAGAQQEAGTIASASTVSTSASADASAAGEARAALFDRPVRVAASSWELAAALLLANGGKTTAAGSALQKAGLEVHVDVAEADRDIENRLARGGADAEGADVAVLSLPAFVAAYERIRALEPQIVRVVGWSRGREVLLGAREGMLAKAGALTGDVTVASDNPSAEALALFALDEAGTAPSHVHIAREAKEPLFAALARPIPADRPPSAPSKVQLTTADASRLVPFVAVAPRGFVEGHRNVVLALLRGWIDGGAMLRKDVPAAARRVASEPGAPEPAAVLERIAWVDDDSPGDTSNVEGRLGVEARAIARLFERDWRLFKEAGMLTSPMPAVDGIVVTPALRLLAGVPSGRPPSTPPAGDPAAATLLAHRVVKGDAEAVATEIALLADVFERSGIRVTARPPSLAQAAAAAASDGHGVKSERIVVAPGALADGGVALVEVLAAP